MRFRMGLHCRLGTALGLLYLASSALSEPLGGASGWRSKRASDPCKEVASTFDPDTNTCSADLAYACLTSVPFDSERSVYIARQMRLFTQLYSAQTFFNNPPTSELRIKPVDLNGTFDEIEKKASSSDGYSNDYAFQTDLMKLYQSFHDGHVRYLPYCPTTFVFYHQYPLVEIYNGNDLPSIYYVDIATDEVAEEVVEIDGEDVHAHLEKLVLEFPDTPWIDGDARYNSLLLSKHPISGVTLGAFAQRTIYDKDSVTLKTKSGTEIKAEWLAYMYGSPTFKDSTGFAKSCLDPKFSGTLRTREDSSKVRRRAPRPEKHKRQLGKRDNQNNLVVNWPSHDLVMSGTEQGIHILDSETAVWGLYAFDNSNYSGEEPDVPSFFKEWSNFLDEGIALLKEKGIKRILVDVSDNGGGYVVLGIVTIQKFFPESQPYYGFDLRRSPALDLLIQHSAASDESHLSLNMTKDINNNDFSSIEEFLGPVNKYGDYFTKIGRWDVSDAISNWGLKAPTTGDPPFPVEDIVLISDGRCGSTCAVFAEALQNLGSKAITYNGIPDKPEHEKQMQAVGGVKGSQVWTWEEFMVEHVEAFIPDYEKYDFLPKRLPILHDSSVNLRNSYAPKSDLPLEFTFQPSSGHLYTTKEMWNDRAELWKAAAAMAWDKDGNNILPEPGSGRSSQDGDLRETSSWSYYIRKQFNCEWENFRLT